MTLTREHDVLERFFSRQNLEGGHPEDIAGWRSPHDENVERVSLYSVKALQDRRG